VQLEMPMEWRLVKGRKAQSGRAAVLRGPVLFTLNRARNPDIAKYPEFEPRQLMIDPASIGKPEPDSSVRPGGVACKLKVWPPGNMNFWPFIDRVPLVLSEFPDASGEAVYFIVPDPASPLLVHDELVEVH
jgi:hypothetical protein